METEGKGLKSDALNLCKEFLGGAWNQITPEEIIVKQLSGGLTNLLYLCSLPNYIRSNDQEQRDVVLRIYGKQRTDANNIVTETAIFMLLAERKLGPKLYGIFPKGRLEEYIPSCCTTWDDLRQPQIAIAVAKEIAKVHSLEVPLQKTSTWLTTQMNSWLGFLRNNVTLDHLNPADRKIAEYVTNLDLEKELHWLDCEMKQTGSPLVFSHNDLQTGNILLPQTSENQMDKPIVFIDFECSSYNYRGFDIGNHFCEWCFSYNEKSAPYFVADLKRFPTKFQQMSFINAYIEQMKAMCPDSNSHVSVSDMMKGIQIFVLASHMIWSLWSFYMASTSSIKFSYWEYGKTRLEIYREQKVEFFSFWNDFSHLHLNNGNG